MKSYVTMEQHVCIICGQPFDTGALLLDKRLQEKFEMKTVTGKGMCLEHQQKFDEGFLALVEIDPEKSKAGIMYNGNMDPNKVWRTGVIIHIRRTVANEIFNTSIPDDLPMTFIDPEATEKLKSMIPKE
jgi:hypothetical protein